MSCCRDRDFGPGLLLSPGTVDLYLEPVSQIAVPGFGGEVLRAALNEPALADTPLNKCGADCWDVDAREPLGALFGESEMSAVPLFVLLSANAHAFH